MEVVNEYGAVELLALPTLSTGLLERWQGQDDPPGAVALALTALALWRCWWQRSNGNAARAGAGTWAAPPMPAKAGVCRAGGRAAPNCMCALPPLISVGLPLIWLLRSLDQLRKTPWLNCSCSAATALCSPWWVLG